jgi:hypothetical protein
MAIEQTITIINNSGKIISTGKQLVSLFKEAKASYEEKKAEAHQNQPRPLQRAQTFDPSQIAPRRAPAYAHDHDRNSYYEATDQRPRYYSYDDAYSEASSRRSHGSRASRAGPSPSKQRSPQYTTARARPALTESNLKTLSEVSSVAPSRAPPPPPAAYRSPYAETLARDMAMSKMDLYHHDHDHDPQPRALAPIDRRHSFEPHHEYGLVAAGPAPRRHKEIDMDLAYGNIPPDLAERHDLDPVHQERTKGDRARDLVRKVEGLLTEANCVQHSAGAIIKNLQEKPDSAAAVALTLAELSSAVSKVSPAVLGLLKGGSPAVFALLASPQFLVGTSVVVGVTAVMFGGWKIVKKVKEERAAREAMALEGVPMDRPAPLRAQTDISNGFDEALIIDDELSTIETWRRGIEPAGAGTDTESADMELITPVAERALKDDDFDVKSRRSTRTTRTTKTTKTSKTSKSRRDDDGGSRRAPASEAGSSRRGPASEAGSDRSRRTTSSKRREPRALEDGRSHRGEDDLESVAARPRAQRTGSNMLKSIFKKKEKNQSELVLA